MKGIRKDHIVLLAAVCCLFLGVFPVSCRFGANKNGQADAGEENGRAVLEFFAMDTFMRVEAYGEDGQADAAVTAAKEEIFRLERLWAAGDATSEVGRANAGQGGKISADTAALITRARELCALTGGAFDISIYPLMRAWGFADRQYRVPSPDEVAGLLAGTDAMQVLVDEEGGLLEFGMEGMQIDLGGIAKGYASARIMEIYREAGIESGLVSLGGNVQALGRKPDGSFWRIGVKHPDGGEDYLGILQVEDKAVVTSGGYERYFEEDGVRYHHILDPATGYPADAGLVSVTVVSGDGTLADGLSTSLFIMGRERAVQFWREHTAEFDMVLYTDAGELYVTEGIAEDFTTSLPVQTVERQP